MSGKAGKGRVEPYSGGEFRVAFRTPKEDVVLGFFAAISDGNIFTGFSIRIWSYLQQSFGRNDAG